MGHNPRVESILAIVSRKRSVSVLELKERLGVSEVTVRKDLDYLESEGIIVRTHGGAMMAEDQRAFRPVGMREGLRQPEKDAIAAAAREFIAEGDTIFLDAGTTCRSIARMVRGMSLQVVTTSLDVIEELAEAEGISLFCPGGTLRRESRCFIGPAAIEAMQNIQVQSCFIGATGFTNGGCFATQNANEAQIKRQALRISKRRIIAADSSKYGVSAFSIYARPGDVDLLITDGRFADSALLLTLGIEVILAPAEGE
ncbi:MAG TPA: DeoR/GlpR family DNA-binding transcription regulator [Rectinemataceae bacterium]|nr:DeoR/GlpR family DNA-binding transcription regulator [Rectinemataceae bacterium]